MSLDDRRSESPGAPPPQAELRDDAAVALLGHDIRAALSDVIGGLRLIDVDRMEPAVRLQLERVRASGELLARLLEEGLAVLGGGGEIAHAGNVQLPRLLRDVQMRWSGRAGGKGLEFVLSQEGDLPTVITADRIGLERTLSNLLSNAVKYTDRGRVQLAVSRDAGGSLVFDVLDDGPGFSGQALRRLFELGGRPADTDKPGSGMGLHIARELAARAGGDLVVRNRPEGGAHVRLVLAADAAAPQGTDGGTGEGVPDLSRSKVLVADDSDTIQLLLRRMLEQFGAEVTTVADGVEAVDALERESFDLVLVDVEMPRLSGIEVIRALRSQPGPQARTPVLAVTAYVLRSNREAIYAAGADGILAKPLAGTPAVGRAIGLALLRNPVGTPQGTPAAAAEEDAPVLVEGQLDRLLEVAGEGSAGELLRRVTEDLRHVERRMVLALDGTDWTEMRAQTHVLIALAGAVGAIRLQHRAEALNAAAHRRETAAVAALAPSFLALLDDLIHVVAGRLHRWNGRT